VKRKKYDTPWARPSMAISVALKVAIRERRGSMSTREAAKDAEISPATLNRVERGYMPDIVNFAKLCLWLGKAPSQFLFQQHDDDTAVDRFAIAMKDKLAKKRGEGRAGWDDEEYCPVEWLKQEMKRHSLKGDPVDVGNFAMMIWNRENSSNG
jgi:transcriptional regulator with XRE-family HTH domain